jgi:hypothetical protein
VIASEAKVEERWGAGVRNWSVFPAKMEGASMSLVSLRHATTGSPDHPVLVIRTVSSATPHVAA